MAKASSSPNAHAASTPGHNEAYSSPAHKLRHVSDVGHLPSTPEEAPHAHRWEQDAPSQLLPREFVQPGMLPAAQPTHVQSVASAGVQHAEMYPMHVAQAADMYHSHMSPRLPSHMAQNNAYMPRDERVYMHPAPQPSASSYPIQHAHAPPSFASVHPSMYAQASINELSGMHGQGASPYRACANALPVQQVQGIRHPAGVYGLRPGEYGEMPARQPTHMGLSRSTNLSGVHMSHLTGMHP